MASPTNHQESGQPIANPTASVNGSEKTHEAVEDGDGGDSKDIYQDQSVTLVALLLTSVFMSIFLVALDRTIISTV